MVARVIKHNGASGIGALADGQQGGVKPPQSMALRAAPAFGWAPGAVLTVTRRNSPGIQQS